MKRDRREADSGGYGTAECLRADAGAVRAAPAAAGVVGGDGGDGGDGGVVAASF